MEILNFLKEWYFIIGPVLVILEMLILFLKNRPLTLDNFESFLKDVLNNLPYVINRFEIPGNGAEKKKKVLDYCISLLESSLGRHLSVRESNYSKKIISEQIEDVLSTPQKKGD